MAERETPFRHPATRVISTFTPITYDCTAEKHAAPWSWHETCEAADATGEHDMIIYIEEYRKARMRKATLNALRDDELLCVNWNPAIAVSASRAAHSISGVPELDPDFEVADLAHAYALATQI
jgi:hypothetical protein